MNKEKFARIMKKIKGCMIAWRCYYCHYELMETPIKPFGKCSKCGKEGIHQLFSDDREGIVKIVTKHTKEKENANNRSK